MEIKGISNNPNIVGAAKAGKAESNPITEQRDKIEISGEAKVLSKSEASSQWINEIRRKIASGYYDSDEVLNKISEKILKEFQF